MDGGGGGGEDDAAAAGESHDRIGSRLGSLNTLNH